MEFPRSFLKNKEPPVVGVVWFNASPQDGLYWGEESPQPLRRPTTAPNTLNPNGDISQMGFSEVKLPEAVRNKVQRPGSVQQQQQLQLNKRKEKAPDPDRKKKIRDRALKMFEGEIDMPSNLDFGSKAVSRAQLRCLVQEVVLEGAQIKKRTYSSSHLSSNQSSRVGEEAGDDAIARLKALQKERLIVVRMGFVERANQLDAEIAEWRAKAAQAKTEGEARLLEQNLVDLEEKILKRRNRLIKELEVETEALEEVLTAEFNKMRLGQRQEFLRIVENCERRAMGKVKKCNCGSPFLCKHNKTASYNIRKPIKEVLNYRQNSKRLRKGGRMEDSMMWEEKANDLDHTQAENFRLRVAKSIISSPWGANEAAIDKLIQKHKRESDLARKTQTLRRAVLKEKQQRRIFAFDNLAVAERQRVRLQSKKEFARRCLELGADAALAEQDSRDLDEQQYADNEYEHALENYYGSMDPSAPIQSYHEAQASAQAEAQAQADQDLLCEECDPQPIMQYHYSAPGGDTPSNDASRPTRDLEAGDLDGFDFGLALDDDEDDEALERAAAEAEAFLRRHGHTVPASFSSTRQDDDDVDVDELGDGDGDGDGDGGDQEGYDYGYSARPSPPKIRPAASGSPRGGGYAGRGGVRYVDQTTDSGR